MSCRKHSLKVFLSHTLHLSVKVLHVSSENLSFSEVLAQCFIPIHFKEIQLHLEHIVNGVLMAVAVVNNITNIVLSDI